MNSAIATQRIIDRQLKLWAAKQPLVVHTESRGRRDTSVSTGMVIGSQTEVDCSACIVTTKVSWTPPVLG